MTAEHPIGPVSQIPKGEGRTFQLGKLKIAVFHTRAGEVFACQRSCPHKDGPLSDGLLGVATLVCPLHDRSFDLRTGQGIGHDDSIKVYPVRVNEDRCIMITV